MKTSDFNFTLPEKLIAQYPADNRDEARMMVLNRADNSIEHKTFKDLLDYFDEDDLLILNNTKVFPARLYGNKEKTGAKIEVFLLRELDREARVWDVLVDPARKIRIGNKLFFDEDENLVAEVIDNTTSRGRTLRFLFDGSYEDFRARLNALGETPLPKYIDRAVEPDDANRYQTIYAKVEGAVSAPVAGLHFSKHLMKRLEIKGVNFAEITLHVGLGSFNPVEVEDISKHKMECEEAFIDTHVGVLKLFPGISPVTVDAILSSDVRSIVMETFGMGNTMTTPWFIESLKKAINHGKNILDITQCRVGSVELGRYQTSNSLVDIGVLNGYDMTFEAAVTKLMYLQGECESQEEVAYWIQRDLRGELTKTK